MISYCFEEWKQYLSEKDYNYLIQFIENLDRIDKNDKILILTGKPKTGKTTLINQIKECIGSQHFHDNNYLNGEMFFEPSKIALHICGIHEYTEKIYIIALQKFLQNNISIITDTNSIEKIAPEILEKSYIIEMTHIF